MFGSKPPAGTHVPGTSRGEERRSKSGQEAGRDEDNDQGYRAARDSTSINPSAWTDRPADAIHSSLVRAGHESGDGYGVCDPARLGAPPAGAAAVRACAAVLPDEHAHVLELANRQLRCTCG